MRVVPVGAEECGSLDSSTTITSWSWRGRAGLESESESESESEPDDVDDDELLLLLGDLLRRCGGRAMVLPSSLPPLRPCPLGACFPFRVPPGVLFAR